MTASDKGSTAGYPYEGVFRRVLLKLSGEVFGGGPAARQHEGQTRDRAVLERAEPVEVVVA